MSLTPEQALTDLLAFIEAYQLKDCGNFRSEEFDGHLARSRESLSAMPVKPSPFIQHRDAIMGHYGTSSWLRKLVMHLWNSGDYSVHLGHIGGLDAKHRTIALDLINHYARYGENDAAFMTLADDILARLESDAATPEVSA